MKTQRHRYYWIVLTEGARAGFLDFFAPATFMVRACCRGLLAEYRSIERDKQRRIQRRLKTSRPSGPA